MRRPYPGRLAALAMLLLAVSMVYPAQAGPLLLFEPASGRVLYAEEPDRAWHPASVTKLMTAYLTFEAVHAGRVAWDDDVPLSELARSQPATRIGLRGGIKLNVEQAVRGLILRSANDFAVALAERISGTQPAFVEVMNATAQRLGMTRTVYRNPHGLPDQEQVTTARDLAILTTALLKDFPDRAEVFSTPTVRIHKGTFHSQNDLLRTLFGADGLKTGFTCASGYNVVASATRDGRRLVAVILGAVNRQKRSERATELLEAGFAHLAYGDDTRSVFVPAAKPIKIAARAMAEPTTPEHLPFAPVALHQMAMAPAAPALPEDIARQVRTGKCRGYGGFAKPEPEPAVSEADTEEEAAPIMTGSVGATPEQQATSLPTKPQAAHPALVPAPMPARLRAATMTRAGPSATKVPTGPAAPSTAAVRKPVSRSASKRVGHKPTTAHPVPATTTAAPTGQGAATSLGAGFGN